MTSLHVVRGAHDRVAWASEHVRVWVQGERVYVKSGSSLARLALWGGSLEQVAQVPAGLGAIAVSRDDRHVGGVLYGGSRRGHPPSEVVVVRSADGRVRSFALQGWNDGGDVHWVDSRRVVYLPGGADDDRAHVLRLPDLSRHGGFRGWYTSSSFIIDGCAAGVGWGTVFRACLPDGPVRTRRLVGPETFAAVPVSGHIASEPADAR